MKLTPELIARSRTSINALQDRELDLRGLKIAAIENLGVTRDQNDAIDLTDNDVRFLGNLPLLQQLKHVQLGNNLISRIDPRLSSSLPALRSLTLTNNAIAELADLLPLAKCARLELLCLMGNPVSRHAHYREFVIWKLPQVRVLDYQRIRQQERQLATQLMQDDDGSPTKLAASILQTTSNIEVDASVGVVKQRTFEPGRINGSTRRLLTPEERQAIEEAIENSQSLEEIRRLEQQLKLGHSFVASS